MIIKVNGETQRLDEQQLPVSELLSRCNVESPDLVSVQLNGKFLDRNQFDSTHLKENDEVDFLYFLGGGQ